MLWSRGGNIPNRVWFSVFVFWLLLIETLDFLDFEVTQAGMEGINPNSRKALLIQPWSKCDFSDEPH